MGLHDWYNSELSIHVKREHVRAKKDRRVWRHQNMHVVALLTGGYTSHFTICTYDQQTHKMLLHFIKSWKQK